MIKNLNLPWTQDLSTVWCYHDHLDDERESRKVGPPQSTLLHSQKLSPWPEVNIFQKPKSEVGPSQLGCLHTPALTDVSIKTSAYFFMPFTIIKGNFINVLSCKIVDTNDLLLEDNQGFGHVMFWTLYRQTCHFHLTFSL